MRRFLGSLLATLVAIALAALARSRAVKARRQESMHEERAAAAKRDHGLATARHELARADKWRKVAEAAEKREQENIEHASKTDTPDLDSVVERYRVRMRERAARR